MIRISQIRIRAGLSGDSKELLREKLEKKLRIPGGSFTRLEISGEAIDARRKPEIYRVFSVDAEAVFGDEKLRELSERAGFQVSASRKEESIWEAAEKFRLAETAGAEKADPRPVVVGFGPCGMFAALTLAELGLRPLVIERGACMEERVEAVERFWEEGKLDPSCNVQFGEGGAGTFSDGKLTTGTKDAANRWVLEAFVRAGADPDILYRQKPHIGSDVLRRVVVNIRNRITDLGGELRFREKMTRVDISGGELRGLTLESGEFIETSRLIFALGHSARDSVQSLYEQGLAMEQKPFSMGVRIEHLQKDIDLAQFGACREALGLPPADYKLSVKTSEGRGVYTFCMCPGGYVVAAASEAGSVVTNGMSDRARDAENANSALLCDVRTDDFGSGHPLAGMDLQEKYERLAFELGGCSYRAPAQRAGDFLARRRASADSEDMPGPRPTYRPGVEWTEIERCLPDYVASSLREALPLLGKKLRGFDDPSAVLTAIESRSSSPVRIKRAASGEALAADGSVIKGLYPGGEGAGYAGGIMSAASDGIRLAQKAVSFHF